MTSLDNKNTCTTMEPFTSIDRESTQITDLQFTLDEKRVRNSTYSPTSSCSSFSENQCSSEKTGGFDKQQRRLRFEIILEAATAVTQKSEESAITYLNRGQLYGIQIKDKNASDEIVTSTLSIDFHSASHRSISDSYWSYWVTQQKQLKPRAIDIDASRSTGITDLSFPSFDKIRFSWNGRDGCKISVRFKCLSTDFSRIKGVKGIPLRAHMDSLIEDTLVSESCFCKVKLFRDKGAERKNKDDYKQISRQLEKVYGKASEQSLSLMYTASRSYSRFGEIPVSSTLDTFVHALDDFTPPAITSKKSTKNHKRVMTAPNPLQYTENTPSLDFNNQTQNTPGSSETPAHSTLNSYDFFNQEPPAIDTNSLPVDYFLLDEIPPLSTDLLFTPDTMPTSYTSTLHLLTPDLISSNDLMVSTPSIYDVFTPEEIQQPNDMLSYPRQDYFCSAYSNISALQQQLDFHNKMATEIILNSTTNNMNQPKRKRSNRGIMDSHSKKKKRPSWM